MATLNDLAEVLTVDCGFEDADVAEVISMIRAEGIGIYSIDHDRGELDFSKVDDVSSLDEIRIATQKEVDEECGEDTYNYFEDFEPEIPNKDFLYGETFFFINITEI